MCKKICYNIVKKYSKCTRRRNRRQLLRQRYEQQYQNALVRVILLPAHIKVGFLFKANQKERGSRAIYQA